MTSEPANITVLLRQAANGDRSAAEQALDALYGELRHIAERHMRKERRGHTLQPTALLHEAYLRLMGATNQAWKDRIHFLAVASNVMRRILVDYARQRAAAKRDGGIPVPANEIASSRLQHSPETILAVDECLSRLALRDPRQARIVELRFFSGLTDLETADVLGISTRTVKREWSTAKTWLYAHLQSGLP